MTKLWQKKGIKLNPIIENYTVGDDWKLDEMLFPYDIRASRAHAQMLSKIGILSKKECASLLNELSKIEKRFLKGGISIRIEDEDCHTVIENELVKALGDLGKKIHTGRSRNDQVLVAIRLFMKDKLDQINKSVTALSKVFFHKAIKYKNIPFPGYTHTQQAMLSSLGLYFGAFFESLRDDSKFLGNVISHIDQNPLGSAAGYGVGLALDRRMTSKLMDFKKVQNNALYCQNSRGKFESAALEGIAQIMLTLSRFAADMLLFTSREFAYFYVTDAVVTGSSIMPQKRNLDPLEILRAKTAEVISNHNFVQNLSGGLISGYNRDMQLLKKPLFESFKICQESLGVVEVVLENIEPNQQEIEKKITPDIFAADIAIEMAKKKKIPFRDAYGTAISELKNIKPDLKKNIKSKKSPGGPGNLFPK